MEYNKTLARLTVRQTLRSRKLLVACLVAVIPIAVGAVMVFNDSEKASRAAYNAQYGYVYDSFTPDFLDLTGFLILGGTVPFIAILLVGGLVADEVEDRTLSYLLMRPIKRKVLWISRLVPIGLMAAALAGAQVLAFWLLRMLSYAIVGGGAPSTVTDERGIVVRTLSDGAVLALQLPGALIAVMLAAFGFVALFGFVTLLTTRYHFLANLGVATLIEFTFGNVGGRGLGVFTVTYYARSIMTGLSPTRDGTLDAAAPWFLAILLIPVLAFLWTWAATVRVRRQDFNITSAAS